MTDSVAERYERFSREEAPGRSPLYEEWARGVAHDIEVQGVLRRIPETRRQPPLVFAVSRLLGAPPAGYGAWRAFVLSHADAVVRESTVRSIQTNEPLRLAALLPVLSELDGPIALLELGASAGLCLYPDRYSYRYVDDEGATRVSLDPDDGPSPVVLTSVVRGELPATRMPDVVWRAGIDLEPLDARDHDDRAWLTGLVWPGETSREERVVAALDVVAADPPLLVRGDAIDHVAAVAASAPSDATLVITTPGVLVHLPRAAREQLIDRVHALPARWLTIDPPWVHDAWRPPVEARTWPGFVVALDGAVRAAADPLGRWWEWRTGLGHADA